MWLGGSISKEQLESFRRVLFPADPDRKLEMLLNDSKYRHAALQYSGEFLQQCKFQNDRDLGRHGLRPQDRAMNRLADELMHMYATEMGVTLR